MVKTKALRLKPVPRTMVAQASACVFFGTGIRPIPCALHHPGPYRIPLNITSHLLKLIRRANPVIERFILPERSAAPQQQIRLARRTALNPPRDLRQVAPRYQKQVNVIGHHHEREQFILETVARNQVTHDRLRHFRRLQPNRTLCRAIEDPINLDERMPILAANLEKPRQRSSQPPGNKHRHMRRMPVRKIPSIHSVEEVAETENLLRTKTHRLKPVPQPC
jgi:hypothetical protein